MNFGKQTLSKEEIYLNLKDYFSRYYPKNTSDYAEKIFDIAIESIFDLEKSTIGNLTERETKVLRERAGINDTMTPKSLRDIGKYYGVSQAAIANTERIAEKKYGMWIFEFTQNKEMKSLDFSNKALEILFNDLNSLSSLKLDNISEANDNYLILKEIKDKISSSVQFFPVRILDLSTETNNVLRHAGIFTVKDLISYSEKEILKIRNMGKTSLGEIKFKIHSMGLKFVDDNIKNKNKLVNAVDIINLPIEELDLSSYTYSSLKRAGIDTVKDLISCREEDILKIRNMGRIRLAEIKFIIHSMGLKFVDEIDNTSSIADDNTPQQLPSPLVDDELKSGEKSEAIDYELEISKNIDYNNEAKQRVSNKEKQIEKMKEYRSLLEEREKLLKREKELDSLIQELSLSIKELNTENNDEQRKR